MLRRLFDLTPAVRYGKSLAITLTMLTLAASGASAQSSTVPSAPRPNGSPDVDTSVPPADDAPVPDLPAEGNAPAAEEPAPASNAGQAPQSGGRPLEPDETYPDRLDVDIGGGLILLYVQPLRKGYDNTFEVFEGRLRLDAKYGRFLVHVTPRFRNTKERDFFPGISWVEEGYIGALFGPTIVKVGKVYRQFGRFWDNSFIGNLQYDGLKLDMNHGVSFEGTLGKNERLGLGFALQYFIVDGTTNYSLPERDTVAIPGGRRRNQVVGRVEPFYQLNDTITVKLGLSGEYFEAHLPDPTGKQDVARFAVDTTLTAKGLSVWAEYTKQLGRHVTAFPIPAIPATPTTPAVPGRSSDDVNYYLVGGEYTYGMFTGRFNFSLSDYAEVDVKEVRYVPGASVTFNPHFMALVEYQRVQLKLPGKDLLSDSTLYVTLHAKF